MPESKHNIIDPNRLKIKIPNSDKFVNIGETQINRVYDDPVGPRLLLIVDEVAELLMPSGVKGEAGKSEDAIKQEIAMIIQSITQLGRSGGVHCVLATQRNDTKIINGVIQQNSLSLDTKVIVKRKKNK